MVIIVSWSILCGCYLFGTFPLMIPQVMKHDYYHLFVCDLSSKGLKVFRGVVTKHLLPTLLRSLAPPSQLSIILVTRVETPVIRIVIAGKAKVIGRRVGEKHM